MTGQEIKVDVFGRPICAYDEKDPISLKALGPQVIERFSIIEHDKDEQGFFIRFDRASPYRAGRWVRIKDFTDRGLDIPVAYRPDAFLTADGGFPIFETYGDAILAERALLSYMLNNGEI